MWDAKPAKGGTELSLLFQCYDEHHKFESDKHFFDGFSAQSYSLLHLKDCEVKAVNGENYCRAVVATTDVHKAWHRPQTLHPGCLRPAYYPSPM